MATTKALLVGAGHAHLHLIRRADELAAAGYEIHLLAPRYFDYSGVASAMAVGGLPRGAGRVDVRALAGSTGVNFHEGRLLSLDPVRRIATGADGAQLAYDALSLNIGSVVSPQGMRVHPSVVRVKPLAALMALDARLQESTRSATTVTIVGGGATGIELAAQLATRWGVGRVRLVESGPAIGADLPPGARERVLRVLARRGVAIHTGCLVQEIGERGLVCAHGCEIAHDVAVLATGLSAPPVLEEWGLGDERGVPVRATLQHTHRDEIYAVGDCAQFLPRPLPRLGVHGVRQGPVLHQSLLARIHDRDLPQYTPRRRALSILDLGGGVGLAVRGRWWWYGAGVLRLKRRIDERWLTMYRLR
ncbi:NAD(P)/FAD-dependent oxidoreductase [Janibacter cremeus]|uniref:NADH dehydrogenase FAD-containing subunit n=1 Tax=Janibacter cremeus TaxID=1285192 RepID=A0A852VTG2_9MICO|nr:FAD-dependent oxidoreductase [Janibacter cremeus]NYF99228.1 NADH dehydrogenase FAD-containing subunit [Janibacter cremeus]